MPFRIKHGYVGRKRRNVGDRPKLPTLEDMAVTAPPLEPEKMVEVAVEVEPPKPKPAPKPTPKPEPAPEPEPVAEEPEVEPEPEEVDLDSLTKAELFAMLPKGSVSKKDAKKMRKSELIELVREHAE